MQRRNRRLPAGCEAHPVYGSPVCVVTGKIRYTTMFKAEQQMAYLIVHGGMRQVPRRAYLCDHCSGYHLTSKERKENR